MTTEQLDRADPLVEAPEQAPPPEPAAETPTAPPPEETLDDTTLQNIFKEIGMAEGEASPAGEGTPAPAEPEGPKLYTEEEMQEEFRKRDRVRLKDSEVVGLRNALDQRRTYLDGFLRTKGMEPADIAVIIQEFDRHHGQAQQVARSDTQFAAESALWSTLNLELPEAERKGFADRRVQRHSKGEENLEAILKDFKATATKDLFTKAQVTKQVNEAKKEAQVEFVKKLIKAGVKLPGYSAPDTGNGTGASGNGAIPTIDQWVNATMEWRSEWLKKDPKIEEKLMARGR